MSNVLAELPVELVRRDGREETEVGAVICSVLCASVAVGNVRIRSPKERPPAVPKPPLPQHR